jgi:hypothetical protein
MLGVRRVGITIAVSKLESLGFISNSRGHIQIVNVKGLQAASCNCYRHGPSAKVTDLQSFRSPKG